MKGAFKLTIGFLTHSHTLMYMLWLDLSLIQSGSFLCSLYGNFMIINIKCGH